MPAITVKRTIGAAIAAVVLALLLAAALPLLASTQIVRDRITQELGSWSGYRVALGSAPEIQVWPSFRAVLKDVTLTEWGKENQAPVIQAERVEIDLSAIAALRGEVAFSRVRLFRPLLRVPRDGASPYLPPAPGGGRIMRAIEIARAVVKTNPSKPDQDALPSQPFGTVEFSDGRIVASRGGKDAELITGIAGSVAWPALNRAATLSATGIWRGENVSLNASSAQPLILFAGGTAAVTFSLKSAPLTASFDGTVSMSDGPFFAGSAKFASPSLSRVLEWSRASVGGGASIGSIAVASKVSGDAKRLKFDNAEITLDGNPGIGVLEVSLADRMPGISGTLAFDTLDLRSVLAAFTPLASVEEPGGGQAADPALAQRANVDLRLSAVKAAAGPLTLANVAATAQVKGGLAVFDISDATAFGGNLQTGVRIDRKYDGNHVELRFLATDIDGAQFARAAGLTPLFPQAKGTLSLTLKGVGKHWNEIFENGDGQFAASFGAGKIAGINLSAFIKRTASNGFFPLDDVGKGTLAIDGLEIKASIDHGIAAIERAEAKTGDLVIDLDGIVPYLGRSLALSGAIYPANRVPGPNTRPVAVFFVGGSWSAPFISPVFPRLNPE